MFKGCIVNHPSYIIHLLPLVYNTKTFLLPESYNELSGKQLVAIAALKSSGIRVDVALLKAMSILLNKSTFRFILLPADLKDRLLPFVKWVFEENTLTEQLLPEYKGYHGPKKEFNNLSLAEFHQTEIFYSQFAASEDKDALNKLVAVLYRRPKKKYDTRRDSEGDIRTAFNSNEVDYYAKKIKKWPHAVKLAIVLFYDGCRQNLKALYEKVFTGEGGKEDGPDGMFGVIRGLAGNKYGDFEKVESLNVHTALYEIELVIEEQEELERLAKK